MFERGFKSWCERYSVDTRRTLGIESSEPLDTAALARHLGVRVWTPHDVPGLSTETFSILLRNDGKSPSCWSAVTLVVGEKALIILNSSHSAARQASDLTHELSHRILGHEAKEADVSEDGLLLLRSYEKRHEEEADWLSGCLLLPREALTAIKRRRISESDAAREYGVSLQMLNYRMAMTGVRRQFA